MGSQQVHVAFCSQPVSLPGSLIAQCWEQAWESATGVQETFKKPSCSPACREGCAGSFITGWEEAVLLHLLWRMGVPPHPTTRAEGYGPGLHKLGCPCSLTEPSTHIPKPPSPGHLVTQGSGLPPQCMDIYPHHLQMPNSVCFARDIRFFSEAWSRVWAWTRGVRAQMVGWKQISQSFGGPAGSWPCP